MRIPRNTLSAVAQFYRDELKELYTESELNNIIDWVFQHQLGITRTQIHSPGDFRVNESDLTPLERMCDELKAHRPLQYVLGEAEFFGLRFMVNESVLIPRPETEEMVEHIIAAYKKEAIPRIPTLLDIGTGSGCIAIALKKNIPSANVYAIDVSEVALETAKKNAELNEVDVNFSNTDVLNTDALEHEFNHGSVSLIVSNPPYVLKSESPSLHPRVREYEPATALFVPSENPLLFYRAIAESALRLLSKQGQLWFECHAEHAQEVYDLLCLQYKNVALIRDLAGLPRIVHATLV